MKTIAVSIDEPTLAAIDRLVRGGEKGSRSGARGPQRRTSRSDVVRKALHEFVAQTERAEREAKDRAILAKHRAALARQAKASVGLQAEP